jgi:hypothetical protein
MSIRLLKIGHFCPFVVHYCSSLGVLGEINCLCIDAMVLMMIIIPIIHRSLRWECLGG